jgi:hypothetical protein
MAEYTDLDIAVQLEQLWQKITEGITLANQVLEKGKLLESTLTQKQQEAIAYLDSRYQEVLEVQSSLPDIHQDFLELAEIKINVESLMQEIYQRADFTQLQDELNSTKSESDRLKAKLTELETVLQNLNQTPAIAERNSSEYTSLIDEFKDFYQLSYSNLKTIENQTLESIKVQTLQMDNLVLRLENNLQTQQNLKNELEDRLTRISTIDIQLQTNLDRVNSELAIQAMKRVEEIHIRQENAKEELAKFAQTLAAQLMSNLQKESLQQEIASADRAISQILLQRQELQRELASSSMVIQRLNQIKIDSANSSLTSTKLISNESDELLNKLKTIEQKYDRLRQSFWWLSLGIAVASGVAIAFGKFVFR